MAKNCLGGVSFDELHWYDAPRDTDFSTSAGIALCDTMVPGDTTGAEVRGSKYGGYFQPIAEHENRSDAFITRTEDFISYCCWAKYIGHNVTADGDQSFLTSHFDGSNGPDGTVRIMWDIDFGASNYKPALQVKNAGSWGGAFVSATNSLDIDYDSQDCWALQVDLSGLGNGGAEARIMHYDEEGACPNGAAGGPGNGTWHEEITWTVSAYIAAAGVVATPSLGFYQISGKGTTHLSMNLSSYWVYEADSAANLPHYEDEGDGSGDEYEAWATYLKADSVVEGSPDNWAATGNPCTGLWRVLCDPEEPDATTNGYISCAGNGAENIYLGEVADTGAANGNQMQTLDGVGVVAVLEMDEPVVGLGNDGVDDVGLSYNGTTSWKTGVYGYRSATGETTKLAFWDKNPEGDAWVVGDLADLTAGVKSDAGNDGRCYGIVVVLVGSGGRRPTNDLDACPSGRRIFIT